MDNNYKKLHKRCMPNGENGEFILDDSFMEPIFYDTPEEKTKKEFNVKENKMGKATQLEIGTRIESEHKETIDFIKSYFKKHNKFPSDKEIYKHIAENHIYGSDEEPGIKDYYKRLIKMEKEATGEKNMKKTKFFKIFDNFFIKKMEKAERTGPHKYIKRMPKSSGKGYIYFYNRQQIKDYKEKGIIPKGQEDQKKGSGILSGIMSFFGFKDEKQAQEKVKATYEKNKESLKGVSIPIFTDYLNEYLSNKDKWDQKLSGAKKELKEGTGAEKKKTEKTKEKKPVAKKEGKWNLSLMRKIAGTVGGGEKKEEPSNKEDKSSVTSGKEDKSEITPEKKELPQGIDIDLNKMRSVKIPKDIKSKGIDSKEYKQWVKENWSKAGDQKSATADKTKEQTREKKEGEGTQKIIDSMRKDNPQFEKRSIESLKNAIEGTKETIKKYPDDAERLHMKEKIKLFEQLIKEKEAESSSISPVKKPSKIEPATPKKKQDQKTKEDKKEKEGKEDNKFDKEIKKRKEEKTSIPKELGRFAEIAKKFDDPEKSFEEVKKIKDVPYSVAVMFSKKYPGTTGKDAWIKFVKDVKEDTKLEKATQLLIESLEKAKKMPVGTVSRGFKKVADGKWVPVEDGKEKKGKEKPEDGKKKDEKKPEIDKQKQERKEKLKSVLKKVASIFADALSERDPVAPAAQGVEQAGENIKENAKQRAAEKSRKEEMKKQQEQKNKKG